MRATRLHGRAWRGVSQSRIGPNKRLLFGQVRQRQGHGFAAASAAGDGFGEFHVSYARFEIGQFDFLAVAYRLDEIRFHLPGSSLVVGDWDLFRFTTPGLLVRAEDLVACKIVVQIAFRAVKTNAHSL